MSGAITITNLRLIELIHSVVTPPDGGKFLVVDSLYTLPKRDWVLTEGLAAITSFREAFEMIYIPEARNCNNFSRGAAWYLQELHAATSEFETSLPAGEYGYTREADMLGHSILMVVSNNNGRPWLDFIDAQTSKVAILTPFELQSCRYWSF